MKKVERVKNALLRKPVDKYPIFISATPQFIDTCAKKYNSKPDQKFIWDYIVKLDLDVIQTGHPSFYPTRFELPVGSNYSDDFGRTHVISKYYDDFCAPFPLQKTKNLNLQEVKETWAKYQFPKPRDPKWFGNLDQIVKWNNELKQQNKDPLSVWGVLNGPFEPTWQLLSDGWPNFFILARKDIDLAKEIINKVADYCIEAGQEMIKRGVNAIRIGDDYGHNDGLMCRPSVWKDLIYPSHKKLIAGLKEEGGRDFPVILHSDGNITEIFQWLGESGIDALNPIQPDALDFETVVKQIGNKLSMTGAFDLRNFLKPYDPQTHTTLKNETERLMSIVDKYNKSVSEKDKTGFCIGSSHQIQAGSFVDTFEAWVKIVHDRNAKQK
jgi:uroporphyrinogen-III decarboxylase